MHRQIHHHRPLLGRCCALLLSLSSLACATEPARPLPAESGAELFSQIKTLIGDAPCDEQAQCHAIAVGHKACGGPSSYLAWSSKNVNETRLKELAQRQAAAARSESQRGGMQSNCAVVTDPGARCQAGQCRLLPRAASAGQQLQR